MLTPTLSLVTSCGQLHHGLRQIGLFLIELSKQATDPELKEILNAEAAGRVSQSARIRRMFAILGTSPSGSRCPLLHCLLDTASSRLAVPTFAPKDSVILDIALQLGSYELAAHELLHEHAEESPQIAHLLKTSLSKASAASLKWQRYQMKRLRPARSAA